jgi:hypothetical protein
MVAYAELYIDQGATFNNTLTLADDVTSANLNLSAYTATSQIRKSYYSVNASANIICTITDAQNGTITMALSAANTALLKPGRYVYDLKIADSTTVSRIMEGTVFVNPKVS